MSVDSENIPPPRTVLRSDHVAGVFFIALGIVVFALSGDLPFGTITAPGAGMMPKLMAFLMMLFAAVVIIGGRVSQPFANIDWSDRWHALLVVAITAAAIFAYQRIGFLLTMSLLVFALLVVVERRNVFIAATYSVGLTLFAYWLFGKALKAPLEHGWLWF
ncbi:MAG: tripartite tricarboxylate transporter TctB family protein [Xanthobacteraceae bacterium]